MRKIGPWQMTEDGCGAFRSWEGADPQSIDDRVAFIEKTPRIRIRNSFGEWPDHLNWASGYKGDGPNDQESRNWCDMALAVFYPGHVDPRIPESDEDLPDNDAAFVAGVRWAEKQLVG